MSISNAAKRITRGMLPSITSWIGVPDMTVKGFRADWGVRSADIMLMMTAMQK